MGLRPSATYDIDIEVEADNIVETEEMYTIINNLTEQMNLHIDFVSPKRVSSFTVKRSDTKVGC